MSTKVKYHCPVDQDQIFYEEDFETLHFMMAQRPVLCPKCKKYYYKEECIVERLKEDEAER